MWSCAIVNVERITPKLSTRRFFYSWNWRLRSNRETKGWHNKMNKEQQCWPSSLCRLNFLLPVFRNFRCDVLFMLLELIYNPNLLSWYNITNTQWCIICYLEYKHQNILIYISLYSTASITLKLMWNACNYMELRYREYWKDNSKTEYQRVLL